MRPASSGIYLVATSLKWVAVGQHLWECKGLLELVGGFLIQSGSELDMLKGRRSIISMFSPQRISETEDTFAACQCSWGVEDKSFRPQIGTGRFNPRCLQVLDRTYFRAPARSSSPSPIAWHRAMPLRPDRRLYRLCQSGSWRGGVGLNPRCSRLPSLEYLPVTSTRLV
jgi:hypothetical protein